VDLGNARSKFPFAEIQAGPTRGGYEKYIVPGPSRSRGPGRMKVCTLRFSVIKPTLMVAFSICSAGSFSQFPL